MAEVESVPKKEFRQMSDLEKSEFYDERAEYFYNLWNDNKRGNVKSACIKCIKQMYYYQVRSYGVLEGVRGLKQYERSWYKDYVEVVAPYASELIEIARKMREVCMDRGFSYSPPSFLQWAIYIQSMQYVFEKFPPV